MLVSNLIEIRRRICLRLCQKLASGHVEMVSLGWHLAPACAWASQSSARLNLRGLDILARSLGGASDARVTTQGTMTVSISPAIRAWHLRVFQASVVAECNEWIDAARPGRRDSRGQQRDHEKQK